MTLEIDLLRRKNKILLRALVASCLFNIIVLGLMSYWTLFEQIPAHAEQLKSAHNSGRIVNEVSLQQYKLTLEALERLNFEQLSKKLYSDLKIGPYREKDIALMFLVSKESFSLKRALAPNSLPEVIHLISWNGESQGLKFKLYPNLQEADFRRIRAFIQREKWPLTFTGLLYNIKKFPQISDVDHELVDCLLMSPEFAALEKLLAASISVPKTDILQLLHESDVELVRLYANKKNHWHSSENDNKRREFLVSCLKDGSKAAATILVQLDENYLFQDLGTINLLRLTKLIDKNIPKNVKFLKFISKNHPQEEIRSAADLALIMGSKSLAVDLPKAQLSLPISQQKLPAVAAATKKEKTLKSFTYKVQPGDSLWKISQKFGVKISDIEKINDLQNNIMKEGMELKIPV